MGDRKEKTIKETDQYRILDRQSGKRCLDETLEEVRKGKGNAIVSLVNANDLKEINDQMGQKQGDRTLAYITKQISGYFRKDEYMFRIAGDEFVCVFRNRMEKEAEAVLKKCSEDVPGFLKEIGWPGIQTFCYGCCPVNTVSIMNQSDILALADKKLYQNKLRYHRNKLENSIPVLGDADKNFTFQSGLLYDALIRSTDEYIYVCNMKTETFRYSPQLVRDLGFPSEVIVRPLSYWKKVVHPEDWERFYHSNMEIGNDKTDYHSVDFRVRMVNGEYQWLRCKGYLMRDAFNQASMFAGFMTRLDRENKIDSVTSLKTIHEFTKNFERFIRDNYNQSIGMMILNLDDFKNINNMYDHQFGDRVLKKCGMAMQSALPENASLYRLDGDRFGILMEYPVEHEVRSIFEQIRKKMFDLCIKEGTVIRVAVSGGYAAYPADANSYLDTFKYCDYALQYSKEHGKDCLTVFDQKILKQESRAAKMLYLLQESVLLDYQGFSVVYQPQVDVKSRKIVGAEALLRWHSDEMGEVSPAEFIPILENKRLINLVGKWVLRQALEALKQFQEYDQAFTISVNVSYIQLLNQSYVIELLEEIRCSEVPCENVILELTESYRVGNMENLISIFNMVREYGILIAMDDFGSGYSSLSLLKNASFDLIKIDRDFVKGILKRRFEQSFIECIVKLCHDVDIDVCLEGVETEKEYAIVKTMDLDYIQGYLFGKPQKKEELLSRYFGADEKNEKNY